MLAHTYVERPFRSNKRSNYPNGTLAKGAGIKVPIGEPFLTPVPQFSWPSKSQSSRALMPFPRCVVSCEGHPKTDALVLV